MLQDQDLLSIQEVRSKVEQAYAAWQKYLSYSQEQIDSIAEMDIQRTVGNTRLASDFPGRGSK